MVLCRTAGGLFPSKKLFVLTVRNEPLSTNDPFSKTLCRAPLSGSSNLAYMCQSRIGAGTKCGFNALNSSDEQSNINVYNTKLHVYDPRCHCGTQEFTSNASFLLRTVIWGPVSKAVMY